jgi:N-acetylmuramoyl-L-alanine amidase
MQIINHKLVGVPFVASPNIGGMIEPHYVIKHYTAGWNADSAVRTFQSAASKVSAHLVIGRDGAITQCVPFNRAAWHAGPSKYDGVTNLNNHSIGIEMVNIGFVRARPGGVSPSGAAYQMNSGTGWVDIPKDRLAGYDLTIAAPSARVGGGTLIWPSYTVEQITAAVEAFKAIVASYEIKDVTGHEQIDTRGWKTDPGPAFPMGEFKALVHGKPEAALGRSNASAAHGTFEPRQALNVRRDPTTSAAILTVLKAGQDVALIKDLGEWNLIEYAPGKQGYVSEKFMQKAAAPIV